MNVPRSINVILAGLSLLLVIVRLRYAVKAYSARRSIFGGDKRNVRVALIANLGYAFVALLLGAYFLLMYLQNGASTLVFEIMLLALLLVLIIEAALKGTINRSG